MTPNKEWAMIFRAGIAISVFGLFLLTTTSIALAQGNVDSPLVRPESGLLGFLYLKSWSPYAAGIGIGVLSWFAFLLSDHPLGVSTAYARSSGMIETAIRGGKAKNRPYYQRFAPEIDWEWMLLIGLIIGAALSALLSGDFAWRFLPEVWRLHFGEGWFLRWLTAFAGGTIMGIGARWANGCTSGHALSGTMQLVVSSWVAAFGIFFGGVITALLIF